MLDHNLKCCHLLLIVLIVLKTLPKHSACVLPLISIKDFNDLSLNEFYGNEWKALYYLSVV